MLMMDEINKIRKDYFNLNKTKNAIAKKFNRSWETINNVISRKRDGFNDRGKRPNRASKLVTPDVVRAIEELLINEKTIKIKKKQRLTTKNIYKYLIDKGVYTGSIRTIYNAVKKIRININKTVISYLPLSFDLGSTLQVDHGEVELVINDNIVTGYLFIASVPGYQLRYCQVFPIKSQESWGEFHERAFRFFGGVFPIIIYDNDTVLIKKVFGSEKYQTIFSESLEEHYNFISRFCNLASGNEKGSVENAVGYCRRNFLTGRPIFDNFNEANEHLLKSCEKDIAEGNHYKTKEQLSIIFEKDSLILDHYLDQLKYKAGAFWDCKAVQSHNFEKKFLILFEKISEKYPAKEANREFIKVLILTRKYPKEQLFKAIDKALLCGATDYLSIENIINQFNKTNIPIDKKALNEALNFISIDTLKFDISPYAELCKETRI